MDSTDDDFGELYVDDIDSTAHATAAFAADVGCEEPESPPIPGENKGFEVTLDPESRGEAKKHEAKEESEYSDSDDDDDDDLNIVLKEDDSKRSTGSSCTMPSSGMVSGRMTMEGMNQGRPQCGYSFPHAWSRKTFDADLNVFEKKPWRNPGVDVNDYFNFGFNEQSWKEYCNCGVKGRAIEVESGTLGRRPSVDLRYPRDLDSDVVIQIPVTNDVEELSSMTPVEASSLNGACRSEKFHSDIGEDLHSSGDSMKEEVSVGCEDENSGSFRGEKSPPKENCRSREVTPCDKEVIEEEKEETRWSSDKADSSSVEREEESSLRDHFRFSPTSSYSVGKSEESEDQREASTPPRRTRFAEHEANSTKSMERRDSEHSRQRRSHEDSSKRHYGRVDYGVHRRTKHAVFKGASRTPDLGKKYSGHGRSYRDSSRNWKNGPKVETEGNGFPHSNREKRHGHSYSPVDLDRDRGQRLGWRNNKEPSHGRRGFDPSNGYKYEASLQGYTAGSSFNLNQRNSRLSFYKEEDRYGRQHCERSPALAYEGNKEDRYGRQHCQRKYSRDRSPGLAYEKNKERRRYDGLEPYYQDRIPITNMEYRYQFEYSSTYGRHSREDELHYRRRCDYDYDSHGGRYEGEVKRVESGIPFEVAYREMRSLAEVGRREFERYEEGFPIDRRHHHCPPDWHHDRFVSENDGHKYRIKDSWHPRGDSWRDDTRDFTTREAYYRQNNQLYNDTPRDGWTRDLAHSDDMSIQDRLRCGDDWVRCDKKRYQLGDSVREVAPSEHPSYTDEMLLVPNIGVSVHDRISIKQRPGYLKRHIHETDERHHRSKRQRRDGNAFIKCQDLVDDLAGRQGKVSNQSRRRFSNTTDQQQEGEKAVVQRQGVIEKEEGEIIQEEERNVKGIELDEEERIQESIKKMERRRERFKETEVVAAAKFDSQTEQEAKTDVTNQARPVRKRRWCAS